MTKTKTWISIDIRRGLLVFNNLRCQIEVIVGFVYICRVAYHRRLSLNVIKVIFKSISCIKYDRHISNLKIKFYIQLNKQHKIAWFWFGFMVFNATFNNISVISWRSVLLVYQEKTTDLSQVTKHHIALFMSKKTFYVAFQSF
jgi:hypothetical protein